MKKIKSENGAKEFLDNFLDENDIQCSDEVYNKLLEYHIHLFQRDYFGESTAIANLVALFTKKYKDISIIKMLDNAILKNSKSLFYEMENRPEDGSQKNILLKQKNIKRDIKKVNIHRAD